MAQMQICRGTATKVTHADQLTSVTYHNTEVARLQRCAGYVEVRLNSAGHRTNTTKTRMNQFANEFCLSQFGVYQVKGAWFVRVHDKRDIPFVDGMTFRI